MLTVISTSIISYDVIHSTQIVVWVLARKVKEFFWHAYVSITSHWADTLQIYGMNVRSWCASSWAIYFIDNIVFQHQYFKGHRILLYLIYTFSNTFTHPKAIQKLYTVVHWSEIKRYNKPLLSLSTSKEVLTSMCKY